MPLRTAEHVVGDIAATRVANVFTDCGWACQTVLHDYGEDLFVQTTIGECVDPHRLWIQVKGTRSLDKHLRSDGDYSYRITVDHVRKWIRSAELVVVVLYDIERDHALWTLPSEQVGHWDIFLTENATTTIRFKSDSTFNKTAAQHLAWRARLEYYLTLLTVAQYRADHILRLRQSAPDHAPGYRSKVPLIAYDFLETCGFVGDAGVDSEFVRRFSRAKRSFRKDDPSATDRQIVCRAATLCFLGFFDRVTNGCAIAEPLLFVSLEYGLQIMARFDESTYQIPPDACGDREPALSSSSQ